MGHAKRGIGDLSQYSVPVALSTARPDGEVVHEVKYGQTLWSLAIEYKVKIEQIKRLNNLSDDTIVPGWKLLIQKSATQPVPFTVTSPIEYVKQDLSTPTPQLTATLMLTEVVQSMNAGQFIKQNSMVVVAFIISFSVLVVALLGRGQKNR